MKKIKKKHYRITSVKTKFQLRVYFYKEHVHIRTNNIEDRNVNVEKEAKKKKIISSYKINK